MASKEKTYQLSGATDQQWKQLKAAVIEDHKKRGWNFTDTSDNGFILKAGIKRMALHGGFAFESLHFTRNGDNLSVLYKNFSPIDPGVENRIFSRIEKVVCPVSNEKSIPANPAQNISAEQPAAGKDEKSSDSKTDDYDKDTKIGAAIVIGLLVIGWLVYMHYFLGSAVNFDLYNCGEPVNVDNCDIDGSYMDCVFTNKSRAGQYLEAFTPWLYDSDNVFIGKATLAENFFIPPGRKVHMRFTTLNVKPSMGVICSMDPFSGMTPKDSWTKVR